MFSAFFTAGSPQGFSLTSFVKGPLVLAWVDEDEEGDVMIPESVARCMAVYAGIPKQDLDGILKQRSDAP